MQHTVCLKLKGRVVPPGRVSAVFSRLSRRNNAKIKRYDPVYLRVSYGMKKDHRGNMVEFYNDILSINWKDILVAYHAFIQER